MKTVRWIVNLGDYDKQRLDRPSVESVRRYFDGFKFNMINRRPMYKDELNDLEIVYTSTLENLHKQNEAIREKLDVLLAKTGRQNEEEGE